MPIDVPVVGARNAAWIAAQLHLFFAAFVLGAPLFIVLCEYLGAAKGAQNWRVRIPLAVAMIVLAVVIVVYAERNVDRIIVVTVAAVAVAGLAFVRSSGDARYERLAHETMKVVTIAYSLTAISGGMFAFVLMGPYSNLAIHLFDKFSPIFAIYGLLFFVETILLYVYWYSWDQMSNRKTLHMTIGVTLNVVGTVMMFLMNAVGAYMLTPPEGVEEAGLWSLINNPSWSGLNLHRFVANITFGGLMVALFAAFMFLTAKTKEDRAFYDWMGFIGNIIGVATLMLLPLAGYVYAKELFLYDAVISTFMMADKLSFYFVLQGVLVSMLFLGANYYMWMSIKRITGSESLMGYMKPTFLVIFVASAIWITPQNFLSDLTATIPDGTDPSDILVPDRMAFLGLMMAKALSVTVIIIFTFLTYMVYRRALTRGSIEWGGIAPQAQYALVFISAVAVYTMGLMGAVRELARQDWHVFNVLKDTTPYAFTTPLARMSMMVGIVTLLFFAFMAFIFWVGFMLSGRNEEMA
tara:strand:+ start:846 stop:2411 length:1566 start_codon:yes stop_codon:yes gene_type:complete